jgi:hypothetical protein
VIEQIIHPKIGDTSVKKPPVLIKALVMSVAFASLSAAAHADSTVPARPDTATSKMAGKDFGRLSADGVSAFNDVSLARLAIFEGKTDEAAKLIADAQVSLGKAKTDDAVFTKAESDLHPPPQLALKLRGITASSMPAVAWIPVDADIVLDETVKATPEKAAALVTAKKSLEKGEGAKSLEAIKIASLAVDYTVALAPLAQTSADVDDANTLMTKHDYYDASQSLKKAEDGIRYDQIIDVAGVKSQPDTASNKEH